MQLNDVMIQYVYLLVNQRITFTAQCSLIIFAEQGEILLPFAQKPNIRQMTGKLQRRFGHLLTIISRKKFGEDPSLVLYALASFPN